MTVDTATQTAEPIVWHRLPTHEHHARRGRRLVGLVTRPAAGVFWAHRISWSPDTDTVDEHGPKTRHRTLTAARAAVELSAPDGSPPPDKHKMAA